MGDSSATKDPASQADVTAGDRVAYAKTQMWKAWADYTDWRRRLEQLEQKQGDEFRRLYDAPPPSPHSPRSDIERR